MLLASAQRVVDLSNTASSLLDKFMEVHTMKNVLEELLRTSTTFL